MERLSLEQRQPFLIIPDTGGIKIAYIYYYFFSQYFARDGNVKYLFIRRAALQYCTLED
jgi:hypothetical protein